MGNAQLLPNRNVVVGWGGTPFVSEFRRDGSVAFDARLPEGGMNYRAFRFDWIGRPHERPRLASARVGGHRQLYASWNGATEVARWHLQAGRRRDALRQVATRPKRSFEVALPVPPGAAFAAAVAVDAKGRVLGRTNTIRL
jgi:hypothetical protein